MSTDDTIILALTRENARLQRAYDLCVEELDRIVEMLTIAGVPNPEGDVADRMRQLVAQIKAFPLVLTDRYHQLQGELFEVTFPTSIEPVVDYVVAADEQAVKRWVAIEHPVYAKGYEPTIKVITGFSPGSIHLITKPADACCESERRNLNGGCENCGAPSL